MTQDTIIDYNYDVQYLYASILVSKPSLFARALPILKKEYFHDKLKKAIDYVITHYNTHGNVPIHSMVKAHTKVELESITDMSIDPWFLESIEQFCRHKAMEEAMMDCAELFAQGKHPEIEAKVKHALSIKLSSDLGTDVSNDPEARLRALLDRSNMVPTFLNSLDKLLYGGFEKGALNIFAAPSGMGKSLFLQNLGKNWASNSLDVVYFSLELKESLVCSRIDAMITGRSTSNIFKDIVRASNEVMAWGSAKTTGKLIIKKLPESGTCTNDLRAYLKEYNIKYGKYPDVLIVDYLDLMYPNNKRIDVGNMFIKDKFVAEELRALAGEYNCIMATASQLNRSATDAGGEFDHGHIAGGMSKINTADNVFGIYATQQMKERGEIKLKMMKIRSSSATGRELVLAYDPECLRITDALETEVTEEDIIALHKKDKAAENTPFAAFSTAVTSELSPNADESGEGSTIEHTLTHKSRQTSKANMLLARLKK